MVRLACDQQTAAGESSNSKLTSWARVEKHADNGYGVKVEKQTLEAGRQCYVLFDIYGANEGEPKGKECIYCMTFEKEVMILPCRHLTICQRCLQDPNNQAQTCPVCRKSKVRLANAAEIAATVNVLTGSLHMARQD